jgi:Baseplate J-like protein
VSVGVAHAEVDRRRPGYLPEWQPGASGGAAFLAIVAHLADLVDEGLAAAPGAAFLAFLDALGVSLLPPSPARAPLVFTLAADAPVDVPLREDSEVAAVVPPQLLSSLAERTAVPDPPPDPIAFATDRGISLARAGLASVYSLIPGNDTWADHTDAAPGSGFRLFGDQHQLDHHLYLGHDTLFDLRGAAEITLLVGVSTRRGPLQPTVPLGLAWEYLTADGWTPFRPVVDQTRGLAVDGEVVLRKICGAPLARTTVHGVESFWIRARAVDSLPLPGGEGETTLPRIDTLRARVSVGSTGLSVDAAFAGAAPLDTSKDFLPFGPQGDLGASFLLACDEAFKREGTQIALTISPSRSSDPDTATVGLTWEYSTGEGSWAEFSPDPTELFQKGEERTVRFVRLPEWRKATVNGRSEFWLRIRVSRGGYGSPPTFSGTSVTGGWRPPVLAALTIAYSYDTLPEALHHCLLLNRFDYVDCTESARWARGPFQPFQPVPDREPAVYLGFDGSLPVGLVSLLADVPETGEGAVRHTSPFTWEYRSPVGWSKLAVLDESSGFRQTGMVQFVGPSDHVADAGPSGPIHWIRARLKAETATPQVLPLTGLHPNAVWATKRTTVRREIVATSDGSPRLTLPLQHDGVLEDELVEVQEWHGTGREWESLFRDVPRDDLRCDRDGRDHVTGVWVRWSERPHLYSSGSRDRHYTIERIGGILRFGDGDSGMIPPPGSPIAASYEFVGGPEGNVGAGSITQLLSAVPYVESVTNPLPAQGGAAAEHPQDSRRVRRRGPMQLRHRNRAVAAADLEWIARDTSSEVAIARCLPETGPEGAGMPGWVTVVVAPWTTDPEPRPSAELLTRVRERLAACSAATAADRIRVVGPRYQPIAVIADVVVGDPSRAAEVEEAIRTGLDDFLHPLRGGPAATGWGFGDHVRLSHVAQLVESTAGVDFADELQLTSGGAAFGESVPVGRDALPSSGRHLIKLRVES